GKEIAFPWCDDFDQTKLWCSVREMGDANGTAPVVRSNRIHVNALGLSDLSGNVDQWCQDRFDLYPSGTVTDPQGPPSGEFRCQRSGGWLETGVRDFLSVRRDYESPAERSHACGFRLSAGPA
ncbi:MAG: formylglycine-generating enzyme family protein, partial [Armatimonadota bacterium]